MKVTIVEVGGDESKPLEEKLVAEVASIRVVHKTTDDYLDALALLKKNEDSQVLLLVAPEEKEATEWDAFMIGLANLEAGTGKTIMKVMYTDPSDLEKELSEAYEKILETLS